MAGEYVQANTIEDYWKQLKAIYVSRSEHWKDLSAAEYNAIERSEREDSDNHLNEERLGKDTQVIDICKYKIMPDRQIAYFVQMIRSNDTTKDVYFEITLKDGIAIN
jgi:hypothetical protein